MVLHQLAELELRRAPDATDPAEYIARCIKYAQEAFTLDDKDARSFYIQASVYLTSFLVTGGWNHDDLLLLLEAFEKADKIDAIKSHPYPLFDRAIVNRYVENYEESLAGFSDCAIANPALTAAHEQEIVLQLLDKLDRLLQSDSSDKSQGKNKGKSPGKNKGKSSKGKSKETTVSSMIEALASIELDPSYNIVTMDLLTEGLNEGISVVGIVCLVKSEIVAPLYYILCDSEQSFVVTVFGIKKEAIKQGDQVILLQPFCNIVNFEWKGKHYEFQVYASESSGPSCCKCKCFISRSCKIQEVREKSAVIRY